MKKNVFLAVALFAFMAAALPVAAQKGGSSDPRNTTDPQVLRQRETEIMQALDAAGPAAVRAGMDAARTARTAEERVALLERVLEKWGNYVSISAAPSIQWFTPEEKDFEFQREGNGIRITRLLRTNMGWGVRIPATIQSLPVVAIGILSFQDYINLAGVVIPEGVTIIDRNAFANCTGLKSVTIPNSVKTIASNVFFQLRQP